MGLNSELDDEDDDHFMNAFNADAAAAMASLVAADLTRSKAAAAPAATKSLKLPIIQKNNTESSNSGSSDENEDGRKMAKGPCGLLLQAKARP